MSVDLTLPFPYSGGTAQVDARKAHMCYMGNNRFLSKFSQSNPDAVIYAVHMVDNLNAATPALTLVKQRAITLGEGWHQCNRLTRLDDNRALSYSQLNGQTSGLLRVVTVDSNNEVTEGPAIVFSPQVPPAPTSFAYDFETSGYYAYALSSTHVLVASEDGWAGAPMVFKLLQIDAVTGVITETTPDLPTNLRYSYVGSQAIPGSSNTLVTIHSGTDSTSAQIASSCHVSGFVMSPMGAIVKTLPKVTGTALCALSSTRFVLCYQNVNGYTAFAVLEGAATSWGGITSLGLYAPWIRKLIPLDENHFLSVMSSPPLGLVMSGALDTKIRAHKYVTPTVWMTNEATRAAGVNFNIPLTYGDQSFLIPLDATNTKFMIVGSNHTVDSNKPFKVNIVTLA